jgi:RHS repeat-associated protein
MGNRTGNIERGKHAGAKPTRKTRIAALRWWLIISSVAYSTFAQTPPFTDPPDSGPTRGLSSTGQYALSQIESVNASTGNVSLSIPLAHLPPGPGGFSAGVNLIYNSTLYDIRAAQPGTDEQYNYVSSTHGGGWNYGYRYTLWTQRRFPVDFGLASSCQAIGTTAQQTWFKNFLQTPDGGSHVLSLVATIQNGTVTSPPSPSIVHDPNNAYWQYDIAGNTSQTCGLTNSPFSGTLVFATSDSTYIRVEATVSGGSGSWVAYFPDGSQVSGSLASSGYANDSDSTQARDRNSNSVSFTGTCSIGNACAVTVTDIQSRSITIQYASNAGGTWTDTITWPGIHGNLTTSVDWASLAPDESISYANLVNPDGTTYPSPQNPNVESLSANLNPSPSVVNSVEMPPGTSGGAFTRFTFGYGSWGEIHSLTMSTGTSGSWTQQYNASYTYCYDVGVSCPLVTYPRPPATAVNPVKNKLLQYSTTSETTSYAILGPTTAFSYPLTGTVGQVTYPDGSYSLIYTANLCANFQSRDFCPALPYQILNRDGSVTRMGWTTNTPPAGSLPSSAIFNPYVQYRTFTPSGFSVSSGVQIAQDQNGNPNILSEYDWLSSGAVQQSGGTFITSISATAVRTTNTAYFQPSQNPIYWKQYGTPTYLRAKQTVMVNSTTCAAAAACTTYSYDNALTTANVTQVQQYDSANSNNVSSFFTYLTNGNLASGTNPNGVRTLICYDTGYSLYPVTKVVGAASTATCPYPTKVPEGRTATYSIDFNSGLPSTVTDADNSITTTYMYDNIGRQKTVQEQAGNLSRTTTTNYDDVGLSVATSGDDLPGQPLASQTFYDPMGRVIRIQNGSGSATTLVDKVYSFSSSAHRSYELTSNPYYTGGTTTGWTVTTSDPVGRVTRVDSYAGPTQPTPGSTTSLTGTVATTYDVATSGCTGPTVQVTDEASLTHINCSDGLGRLTAVTEPNGTVTNYAYDLLNNLVAVDVAGQANNTCTLGSQHMRCFEYSTLSRLKKATNPESGATSYVYDAAGNPTQRTDAVGNVTNFNSYDAMNRPQSKTYSVAGQTVSTPSVFYFYDNDFKGSLYYTCSAANTSSCSAPISFTYFTHDPFGRIASSGQFTFGTSYVFTYTYSLTDQLTSMRYPSGKEVSYSLDALDRVRTVQNMNTGVYYVGGSSATPIVYTAADGISTMTMGNNVTETVSWNDRLQPTNLAVSNSLLNLGFFPCSSNGTSCAAGNNGNLQSQIITAPGLSVTQTYSYDSLNRLTSAVETGGTGWTQNYGYDVNGNRALTFESSNLPVVTNETPQTTNAYLATNRNNSYTYDAAGNVLQAGNTVRSFRYDAENRQVKACAGCTDINSSPTATYVYDGNGLRVSKTWNGQTTVYVYDAWGNLAAEYGQAETSPCDTATCYLTVDHLGSTRLLTDNAGSSSVRYDYLPFGQELLAGMGARTTGMGYLSSADILGPKFTGQIRDPETSMSNAQTSIDFFSARYFSSAQGRFQSVDPANAGASIADPQSWNGYSYVGNNPLSYTDPSGMGEGGFTLCAGGPIACGIGIGIDVGIALWRIFGGGGGPSVPSWAGTAWELGPAQPSDEPWSEQNPYGGGSGGSLNVGGVFGSGNTDPFVFSFEEGSTATGQWVTDYKGALVWIEGLPSRSTFRAGTTLSAAPKRSNLSVAGGCVVDAFKEHMLGIGIATAFSPVPKQLIGDRAIGSNYTSLLSKLGRYFDFRGPAVYGPIPKRTINLLGGAGRILAGAGVALNAAQILKASQDASACYSISH